MGKTVKGAVWLDKEKTPPYELYQYLRNVADADVIKCLKLLTFVPIEEIHEMETWKDSKINEAKVRLVGVKEATLQAHGAVSEETAREMAEGGAKAANADAALAVTGIAGPGGGTKEKPVGLVYIGCYVNGKTIVKKNLFTGNRREVREQAVETALKLLLECLP